MQKDENKYVFLFSKLKRCCVIQANAPNYEVKKHSAVRLAFTKHATGILIQNVDLFESHHILFKYTFLTFDSQLANVAKLKILMKRQMENYLEYLKVRLRGYFSTWSSRMRISKCTIACPTGMVMFPLSGLRSSIAGLGPSEIYHGRIGTRTTEKCIF